jgi:superfamily II helicase
MKAKSQLEAVKLHLEEFGEITSLQAITDYGATRLSDIIYRLRRKGMNIVTIPKELTNRYGNKTIIGIYKLIK